MAAKMTRSEKIAYNKIEKRIQSAYTKNCCNIQINLMDISKIFAYGRQISADIANDDDFGAAILGFVQKIAA